MSRNQSRSLFLPILCIGLTLFSFSPGWAEKSPSLVPAELNEAGWLALFNGEDLTGWEILGTTAEWKVENGILTNVGTGLGWLATTSTWGDFDLVVEWKLSKGGNSSIYFRAGVIGVTWKNGYDVQLDEDDENNPTGSIYDRLRAAKVPVPDGEWHTTEIHAEGSHLAVKVNGQEVVSGTDEAFANGRIGLQMHDDKTTVQVRKVWVRPLGSSPIFNGRNLEGWRIRKHNRQDSPEPDIRIEDGAIRIQGGPGYLESAGDYTDFHVRFRIKTLPRGDNSSNSGVFLRGPRVPGDNFTIWPEGLEVQVFNEPEDFTTGGFYHFVPARGVYAQNEEWFWMDVNAVKNRYVAWVNGMPTAAWIDPENRFEKGIFGLQAHDPNSITYYGAAEIAGLAPHVDLVE
jgi:hypothetical protein